MHGSRALITAPTDDVLTLDEVKNHLRVDHSDFNSEIGDFIVAAAGILDPAAGGWLGRALRPQTWEYRLDSFYAPCRPGASRHDIRYLSIEIPCPPLIDVVSVKYDDVAGVEHTLVKDTDFRILGSGALGKSSIAPLYNQCWPAARCAPESVRIRFTAGYPLAAPDTLPAPIKAWLKLVIGSLYENRESVTVGARAQVAQLPDHILQMISPYRIYG